MIAPLRYYAILFSLIVLSGCGRPQAPLPILGTPLLRDTIVDGKKRIDSVYSRIETFRFEDQNGNWVTNETFDKRIYVADFIFLSCPAICPKMTANMKAVYDVFKADKRIAFLSHTIDPERDSFSRLKAYADNLEVDAKKWHFVTGNKDSIYQTATRSYFSKVYKDSTEPGGYVHSGGLLLVDKNRHIRGVYDGTDAKSTQKLIGDIKILLAEQFSH